MVHAHSRILFSFEKEGNSDIYDNMVETWGHYAKWNQPITKRQILHDSTQHKVLRVVKIIRTGSIMVVATGFGEGKMESYSLRSTEFQFSKMESIVEMDGGDGWKTM